MSRDGYEVVLTGDKAAISKMVQYLREAEGFIEMEDRLNLYKDLSNEVPNEGEAVMQVSNVVKGLIKIQTRTPRDENR